MNKEKFEETVFKYMVTELSDIESNLENELWNCDDGDPGKSDLAAHLDMIQWELTNLRRWEDESLAKWVYRIGLLQPRMAVGFVARVLGHKEVLRLKTCPETMDYEMPDGSGTVTFKLLW